MAGKKLPGGPSLNSAAQPGQALQTLQNASGQLELRLQMSRRAKILEFDSLLKRGRFEPSKGINKGAPGSPADAPVRGRRRFSKPFAFRVENNSKVKYSRADRRRTVQTQITWRSLAEGAAILELTLLPMTTSGSLPLFLKSSVSQLKRTTRWRCCNYKKSLLTRTKILSSVQWSKTSYLVVAQMVR